MTGTEILKEMLALFRRELPQAEFRPAWGAGPAARRVARILAVGDVEGETLRPGAEERKLRFRLYLPPGAEEAAGHALFAEMCTLVRQEFADFTAVSCGPAERDHSTGALCLVCRFSFLDRPKGGVSGQRGQVLLAGREYAVSGVILRFEDRGRDLVSIGETVPFARREERTEYTVELEGIHVAGLDRLAGFTAQIGDTLYRHCRWQTLSDVTDRAVFVSPLRESAG